MRQPALPVAPGSRPRRYALPAALLLVQLALALASAVHLSTTYDEPGHLRYGRQLLRGDAHRFDDSKMPVSALNALPGAIAHALPAGGLRSALASAFAARLPTVLAMLGLSALVWWWSRRLWGERGALLSLVLCAFDPNLLAHGRLVTTDLYAALAFAVVLYLAWRFAEAPTTGRGLATAFALGVAQVVKYSAVLLVPLLLLLAVVRWGRELLAAQGARRTPPAPDPAGKGETAESAPSRPPSWRALGHAVAWAALFALVGLLVIDLAFLGEGTGTRFGSYHFRSATMQRAQRRWPQLTGVRVPLPYPWLEGLDWVHHRERSGEGYGPTYLRGERRESGGFAGYYLWVWLYKVPLATQALLLAAVVVAWRRRRRLRWRHDLAFLLLPPLGLAVFLNFFFAAQMGVRYSLLLFPPLYVFAGVLLAGAAPLPRPARWGIGAACAWLVLSVLSWHPFYLSYFNELLPDRKLAWRVLADSNLDWGQSEWYLRRWLAAHPDAVREPRRPRTGLLVVRANFLTGVLGDDRFAWLRRLTPVDEVGYSYLVFRVGPSDLPPTREPRPGGAP